MGVGRSILSKLWETLRRMDRQRNVGASLAVAAAAAILAGSGCKDSFLPSFLPCLPDVILLLLLLGANGTSPLHNTHDNKSCYAQIWASEFGILRHLNGRFEGHGQYTFEAYC